MESAALTCPLDLYHMQFIESLSWLSCFSQRVLDQVRLFGSALLLSFGYTADGT